MQLARSQFSGKVFLIILAIFLLGIPAFCEDSETSDPIRDASGAKPLGLGRAVLASVNDVNSIFYNPAGLVAVKSPQLLGTTYTKVFGTYNYYVAGLASPMPWGGVGGVGFISAGVNDIPITETGTNATFATYTDNLLVFSYADSLKRFDYDLKNIYIGANVKFFNKGTSGPIDFYANGINMDLGVKYMPYNWLTFAANKQNILQGNLVWNTGLNEKYPSPLFLGTRIRDIKWGLEYMMDVEFPSGANLPTLYHIGTEIPVTDIFCLRLGGDQAPDAASDKVIWNFTTGLGLKLGLFNLDYAYHTYYNDQNYGSHFVSLQYAANYESNILAYAGQVSTNKFTQGQEVQIQVYIPYGESYVAAIAPDKTEIPLTYNRKIDRWIGIWKIPENFQTGKFNFTITMLDIEGNPDPLTTNDIIIMTPAEISIESRSQISQVEQADISAEREEIWKRLLSDIGSNRSLQQFVKRSDIASIILNEKQYRTASPEAANVLTVTDAVSLLSDSEKDKARRIVMWEYLRTVQKDKPAAFNDLIDIMYASDYLGIERKVIVDVTPPLEEQKGASVIGIIPLEEPLKEGMGGPYNEIEIPSPLYPQTPPVAENVPIVVAVVEVSSAEKPQIPYEVESVPAVVAQVSEEPAVEEKPVIAEKPAQGSKEEYAALADLTFIVVENYTGMHELRGKQMRRKEAAVIIAKRNGYPLPEVKISVFKDVNPSLPEAPYIQACYENNVVIGYPDKTFKPDQQLDSFEIMSMMSDSVNDLSKKNIIRAYTRYKNKNRLVIYDMFVDASIVTRYLQIDYPPIQ